MTSPLKLRQEASFAADVLPWHNVWSLSLLVLQCLLLLPATNEVESCWKRPSTMVCIISDGDILLAFHDCSWSLVVVVWDHFKHDHAVTPINATGHQLLTFYRSIFVKERVQTLEPLMSSRYCRRTVHVCSLVCVHHLLGCLPDWMTFWVMLNAWSNIRQALCRTQLKRLIQAAIKQKGQSPEYESVRSGPISWTKCEDGRAEPFLCDWANRRIGKTHPFFQLDLHKRRVCHDTWGARDLASLRGDQAVSKGWISLLGNSRLAGACFWKQPDERRRSWAASRANLTGSTSGEGQRVSRFSRCHCGQLRFSWRQSFRSCQGFGCDWSIVIEWELRTDTSALVSVHSGCWPSERRRYVVARWSVG